MSFSRRSLPAVERPAEHGHPGDHRQRRSRDEFLAADCSALCRGAELHEDSQLVIDLVEHTGLGELAAGLRIGPPEHHDQTAVLSEEVEEVADEASAHFLRADVGHPAGLPLRVEALDELHERRDESFSEQPDL